MPKQYMPKPVRKEQEDRGVKPPVLLTALPGLLPLLRRLRNAGRGYALAGAGVVVGAVVVVSLLSWLAPDSDRPIASPLEAVGRVAGGVLEQVDEQIEALLGTDGESVLRSVREGLAAAGSATPWPGKIAEIAASPSTTGSNNNSSSTSPAPSGDSAAPAREESSSDSGETPSQPAASSAPSSGTDEPSTSSTDTPSSPTPSETPAPPASEQPPVAEEPSSPPAAEDPPAAEEPTPPPAEEPPPPTEEPPPPAAEEPPPVVSDPAPVKGPPETIADE